MNIEILMKKVLKNKFESLSLSLLAWAQSQTPKIKILYQKFSAYIFDSICSSLLLLK